MAIAGLLALLAVGLPTAATAQETAPAAEPARSARPRESFPTGQLVAGVACLGDPSQTYTLYLPSAYTPERRWPLLLVFDPRGRGTRAAEIFRPAAETYGWVILGSDGTASDGGWEPNARALRALVPELERRWPTDPRRIYAAGFSGTVIVAQVLGTGAGSLAGILGSGGRYDPSVLPETPDYAFFGTVGSEDFNYLEMRQLDAALEGRGVPHRLEIFDGPHRWMPPELAAEGVGWMEVQAMRQGRRPVDGAVVEKLFTADLKRARRLEADGQLLAALNHYRAVVSSFAGLAAVEARLAEARRAVARLEKSPEVAAEQKLSHRWDLWEVDASNRLGAVVGRLHRDPPPLDVRRLAAQLQLDQLQERAKEDSYAGRAARRILARIFTQLSFYLPRELFAAGTPARAAAALTLALRVGDERADLWYNLACAEALSGHRKPALEALARAVEAGFRDLDHLNSDPDLESLRRTDGYREVVERLSSLNDPTAAAPPP